jgi:hypothetical protein
MQTLAGVGGHGGICPKSVLTDRQRTLIQDRCFLGLALRSLKACEIMQHISRLRTLQP